MRLPTFILIGSKEWKEATRTALYALERAEPPPRIMVAYRKKLLAELDAKETA